MASAWEFKKTKKKVDQATSSILAWEDDPISSAKPIVRPIPKLASATPAITIKEAEPPPKAYKQDTQEFRY